MLLSTNSWVQDNISVFRLVPFLTSILIWHTSRSWLHFMIRFANFQLSHKSSAMHEFQFQPDKEFISKHLNAKFSIFPIFSKFPIVNYRKSIKIPKLHISGKIDCRLTKTWSRTSTNLITCHQGNEEELSSDVELCIQFFGEFLRHFLLLSRKL